MNLEEAQRTFVERAIAFHSEMAAAGAPINFHEYYRSEDRQNQLFREGASKARAWESPHNYGLAADFNFDPWGWNVPGSWWYFADRVARRFDLETGVYWNDGNHLQLPGWKAWKFGFFRRLVA